MDALLLYVVCHDNRMISCDTLVGRQLCLRADAGCLAVE